MYSRQQKADQYRENYLRVNFNDLFMFIQIRRFTYFDSFGTHLESPSGFDLDLGMVPDLDCLPLDWLLVVHVGY